MGLEAGRRIQMLAAGVAEAQSEPCAHHNGAHVASSAASQGMRI